MAPLHNLNNLRSRTTLVLGGKNARALLWIGLLLAAAGRVFAVDLPATVDFGRVSYDQEAVHQISITNDTDNLVFFDFRSTSRRVTLEPQSVAVDPGSASTVSLSLDVHRYEGAVEKLVMVRSSVPELDGGLIRLFATVHRPPDAQAEGCSSCEILAESIQEQGMRHWLSRNWIVVDVYHGEGCHECRELIGDTIPRIEQDLSIEVSIREHSVLDPAEAERRGVELRDFPAVAVGDAFLAGTELNPDRLREAMATEAGRD